MQIFRNILWTVQSINIFFFKIDSLKNFRTEKIGKLSPIPNASIKINVKSVSTLGDIPYRISSTLLPLKPWSNSNNEGIDPPKPVFELQTFGDAVTSPYSELINLLYVYPISLSYGGQKAFNRARNISCNVRFISSPKREGSNAKVVQV